MHYVRVLAALRRFCGGGRKSRREMFLDGARLQSTCVVGLSPALRIRRPASNQIV